jgi:hypothetical protein
MAKRKTQENVEYGLNRYWINLGRSLLTANAIDSLLEQEHGSEYIALYLKLLSHHEEQREQTFLELYTIYDESEIEKSCKYFASEIVAEAFKAYCKIGLIMLKERCNVGTGVWLRTYDGEEK